MSVLHKCDVTECVNPDHLFIGTQADNIADMVAKDRCRPNYDPRPANQGGGNGQAKLTEDQVLAIRADARSSRLVAADYGVSGAMVTRIKRREKWAWL